MSFFSLFHLGTRNNTLEDRVKLHKERPQPDMFSITLHTNSIRVYLSGSGMFWPAASGRLRMQVNVYEHAWNFDASHSCKFGCLQLNTYVALFSWEPKAEDIRKEGREG